MYNVGYKVISEVQRKPDVSIVIPVFNGEKYIRRCLEYIVYQTKQEIEAVIVDNLSDDNTVEICKEFQRIFPEKISIYQLKEHQNYGAVGRNLGVILAKGDYIMFCDSDDIMHFKAVELAYAKAIEENCDLVYFKFYKVEGKSIRVCGRINDVSDREMVIKADSSFWTKCCKKELLINYGIIPDDIISEDFAYVYGLVERANKIGYVDVPLYYYIKRGDSELHSIFSDKKLDMIKAHLYSFSACKKNNAYMQYVVGRHIKVNLTRDWIFMDKFIEHLKELWPILKENEYLKNDIKLYNFLEEFVKNTKKPLDTIVYLNGFEHVYSQEEIESIENNIYAETGKVIVLTKDNCDVYKLPLIKKAYDAGNMVFVGEYFALKNIYEGGGIYLDSNIVIDAKFNYIRCFNSFIGYLNATEISAYVFGAHKNNKFMGEVLHTYNCDFYEDEFYPLFKRMKNILVGKYGYKLSGKTDLFSLEDVSILGMDYITLNVPPKSEFSVQPHLCHVKYFNNDDEYVVVKKDAWNYVSPVFQDEYNEIIVDNQNLRRDRDTKRSERDTARTKISALKADNQHLRIDRDTKRSERDTARIEISTLKANNQYLRKDRDTQRNERDTLEREIAKIKNECDTLLRNKRHMEYISAENSRVLRECQRLADENDRLAEENTLLFSMGIEQKNNQIGFNKVETEERINELEETIRQMENSKSWRWTKWLRNLVWFFRGVKDV